MPRLPLTKRMGRPVCKWFLRSALLSLRQRIRSQVQRPGQDGDPRVSVLINFTASSAIFVYRVPGHRLTVKPSRFRLPQTTLVLARERSAYSLYHHQGAVVEDFFTPQHGPSDTCKFACKGYYSHIFADSCQQPAQPSAKRGLALGKRWESGPAPWMSSLRR